MKPDKLSETKIWKKLKPHLIVSKWRINVSTTLPVKILNKALKEKILCANCKKVIHPIRRSANGGLYTSTSCRQEKSLKCSRSKAAKLERAELRYLLK